ncbi:uncharacterized protein At4g14450, chloroplastic-like [Salvia miltiorrhiza]|uniref:uncharacterized protein At4g14450, chloroplastic-like n=1 Tax=Salvia miltiorrhiza TaxID=226208 RepID=UPI0025ACD58A|nr:uncharacterized protein At4g14450, chloroplastic-like [Salvia miltiorrhiza]
MADSGNSKSAARRQPNRLQRRAPASLQISPVTEWKAAIPLLSPLVQSPTSDDATIEVRSCTNSGSETSAAAAVAAAEKPGMVMKKWQHPAAPFGYEPAPFMPFVHIGVSDR